MGVTPARGTLARIDVRRDVQDVVVDHALAIADMVGTLTADAVIHRGMNASCTCESDLALTRASTIYFST